ncbi:hypothetical protein LT493_01545 [Streptomyces tricolor]|nr:hypothetical protein [Streptomyces tricolor]
MLTRARVTAAHLAEHCPGARCLLLNSGDIAADLGDVRLVEEGAEGGRGRRGRARGSTTRR